MASSNSNIILIGDGVQYKYELPPMPGDEKLIEGYDLKRKDQIWRRPEIIRNVDKMPEKKKIEYVSGLRDKWANGHWMFIDGEPVWITGMHWDFMVLNKFDFGYPVYLEQQRFDFYFRDLVRKDTDCYGKAILKCRRGGVSSEEISEGIYTLLEDENSHVGLQSNENKKCLQTLMYPLIQTYLSRPKYMREEFYSPNSKKPRNGLELISNRIDVYSDDEEDFLGGTVRPYPTTTAAMDGTKKRLIIMDEAFKWITASIEETLDINKKCVVEYGIKGKVDILSTMGDSDDYLNAVKEGCKIIRDSNPDVRDKNGRTTSGLYEWFISAIHSADIPEEHRDPAYTKFGKINKDKAEAYVNAEVNKYAKDSKQRVFAMRRLPLKKAHGLMAASASNYFSKIKIDLRLQELSALPRDEKPYIYGRLEYDEEGKYVKRGGVYFEPDEEGHWLVSVQPYFSADKKVDTRNRYKRSYNGVYFLPRNVEGCIGYDPTRYKKEDTSSRSLSKAAIVVAQKYDYFSSGNANRYCALYVHRSDDPEDDHRECVKASKFWGFPVMHERVIESVKKVFEQENCLPLLLKNQKDDLYGMWIDSAGKVVKNAIDWMVTKFSNPKTDDEVDQLMAIPFEEILIDMDNFDIANTTKFDVFMAMVELEHGLKQIEYTNVSDVSNTEMNNMANELYPQRNKTKIYATTPR